VAAIAVVAILGLTTGCKPNDVHVKTVKERVDEGEIVWFSEPGTKLPICRNSDDWTGVRSTPRDEIERVVLGKQRTMAGPGHRACYKIGSKVMILDGKPANGFIVVQAIGIARLDKLKQSHLKGRYFDARSEFDGFKNRLASRMGGNQAGYIHLLNIAYVGGSSVNEKAIKDNDKLDGYEETTEDGEGLGCTAWTTMEVAQDFIPAILDGKLKSYYKLGSSNCIAQGATIELKERLGANYPALAKAKVKKVKRFKVSALAQKLFVLDGFDFDQIKSHVTKANKDLNEEKMTVVDFELVAATSAPLAAGCPRAIYLSREFENPVRLAPDQARCAHEGRLTQVITVSGGRRRAIPVRVKSRAYDSESVVVEFERLDGPEGGMP
jgi:hypothetical protein